MTHRPEPVTREQFDRHWTALGDTLWALSGGEAALVSNIVALLDIPTSLAYQHAVQRDTVGREHEPDGVVEEASP